MTYQRVIIIDVIQNTDRKKVIQQRHTLDAKSSSCLIHYAFTIHNLQT